MIKFATQAFVFATFIINLMLDVLYAFNFEL